MKYDKVNDIMFVYLHKKFFANEKKGIMNVYNIPYVLSSPRINSTMLVKDPKTKILKKVVNLEDDEFKFLVGPSDYPNYKHLTILSCNKKGNHMWTEEISRKIEKHGKYVALGIEFLIKQGDKQKCFSIVDIKKREIIGKFNFYLN